jgi:hypothetical protein
MPAIQTKTLASKNPTALLQRTPFSACETAEPLTHTDSTTWLPRASRITKIVILRTCGPSRNSSAFNHLQTRFRRPPNRPHTICNCGTCATCRWSKKIRVCANSRFAMSGRWISHLCRIKLAYGSCPVLGRKFGKTFSNGTKSTIR